MHHERVDREVAQRSAMIYLPIAGGAALLVYVAASLANYSPVAQVGAAVWVGLLSLIVAMPVVTDRIKQRARRR